MTNKTSRTLAIVIPILLIAGMIGFSFVKDPAIRPLPLNPQLVGASPTEEAGPRVTQEMLDGINHELDALRSTTLVEIVAWGTKSAARIRAIVKKHRGGVWHASSSAATPFQGFRNTGHTGILSAIDLTTAQAQRAYISNIKASNHLETYTHDAMKPVVVPIGRATMEITTEIEAHLAEVDRLRNRYQMNSLRVLERHGLSVAILEEVGVSGLAPVCEETSPARPVVQLLEQLTKRGEMVTPDAAVAVECAFARHGDNALKAFRDAGGGLAVAAAQHGDDVVTAALRVPDAAPMLARRADELLPLVRNHGNDVLRLEAKAPGLAADAVRLYPDAADITRLARLEPDVAARTLSYASKAADPAVRRQLLLAVERHGPGFLERLPATSILAYGLSAAAISAAVVVGVHAPETLADAVQSAASKLPLPARWSSVARGC